jgi:hypothetical protein
MPMKKLITAALIATVSVAATTATIAVAKDAPGKCGAMKYFDKKSKKCASKG